MLEQIIEGLTSPALFGFDILNDDPAAENLVLILKCHLRAIRQPDTCFFPDGGWKFSSTSDNSWLSKIYICQHLAENVLGFPAAPAPIGCLIRITPFGHGATRSSRAKPSPASSIHVG